MIAKQTIRQRQADLFALRSRILDGRALIVPEPTEQKKRRIRGILSHHRYQSFCEHYFPHLITAKNGKFHNEAFKSIATLEVFTQFRLWPRDHAKSVHTCIFTLAWMWATRRIKYAVIVGLNADAARRQLAGLRDELRFNRRLIDDFGAGVEDNLMAFGENTKESFRTTDGVRFEAKGIEQPFRGIREGASRLHCAILDDVEKVKTIKNPALIQELVDKVVNDLVGAFSKDKKMLFVCNNYISDDGIVAGLMRRLSPQGYNISKVCALEKGKPAWPERYSVKDFDKIRRDYGESYFLQEYQHVPNREGALFPSEHLQFSQWEGNLSPGNDRLFGAMDLSYVKEGDYKAFALLGRSGKKVLILDLFCRQCSLDVFLEWYFSKMREWQDLGFSVTTWYDATASQEAVFGEKIGDYKRRKVGEGLLPLPAKLTGNKFARIESSLRAIWEKREIFFSLSLKNDDGSPSPDLQSALSQMYNFQPNSKVHDDFPDALAIAHDKLCAELSQKMEGNWVPGKRYSFGYDM